MRLNLDRAIRAVIFLNLLFVAFLLVAVAVNTFRTVAAGQFAPASGAASGADLMQMGLAHIPTNNACVLCHVSGGETMLKVVPAMLHPLEGWRRCLVCHTDETLGRQAPGHVGIAEEECLNCHKVSQGGPAITQPHAALHDQRCLDCHGGVAHLPSSMAGSKETDCVLCHKPAALPPPQYPHAADARLSCRSCHRSAEVGNLPIDHALRQDSTCLLCHDIKEVPTAPVGTPGAPPAGS